MASYGAGRRAVVLRALKGMSQRSRYGRKPRFRPPGGPMAGINRPSRSRKPGVPKRSSGGGRPVWEGVPKRESFRPMDFTKHPDYNFGPPE